MRKILLFTNRSGGAVRGLEKGFGPLASRFKRDDKLMLFAGRAGKGVDVADAEIAVAWEPTDGGYDVYELEDIWRKLHVFLKGARECGVAVHRGSTHLHEEQFSLVEDALSGGHTKNSPRRIEYRHADDLYDLLCTSASVAGTPEFDKAYKQFIAEFGLDAFGAAHEILLCFLPDYIAGRRPSDCLPDEESWNRLRASLAWQLGDEDAAAQKVKTLERLVEGQGVNTGSPADDWYETFCGEMKEILTRGWRE